MTQKITMMAFIGGVVLGAVVNPAWAKPKTEIVVEVVSSKEASLHAPLYNPGVPGTATTTCMPNGGPCNSTVTPGQPASVTDMPIYNEYVYAAMPGERHVTLQCYFPCHHLPAGRYDAETDGGKVVVLHVLWPDLRNPNKGKPGKLKYRIVGTW